MDGDWRLAFGCWLLARKITNYNLQITIEKPKCVVLPQRLNKISYWHLAFGCWPEKLRITIDELRLEKPKAFSHLID